MSSITVRGMELPELAKAALTQPSDSWFASSRLWVDCGFSSFSVDGASSIYERANFEAMVKILADKFGPADANEDSTNLSQWWINSVSHWTVGWIDQIMVRVLIDPNADDPYHEDNITDIFKECMAFAEIAHDGMLLDESIYCELEHRALLASIEWTAPEMCRGGAIEFDPEQVQRWLYENGYDYDYEFGTGNPHHHEDDIVTACLHLGMGDERDIEEWDAWVEAHPDVYREFLSSLEGA